MSASLRRRLILGEIIERIRRFASDSLIGHTTWQKYPMRCNDRSKRQNDRSQA